MYRVIERMKLNNMPFDKDGSHATGYSLKLEDGSWVDEYESNQDWFEDAENCIYTEEEEE